jgi:Protein of unknown function (DUF1217)
MITSLTGASDTQQPVMPAMLGYRMVEASFDKQEAAFRNSAPVKREIDYFKTAIAKVTSADDLVKDYRLFRFVLSAYGLDSQIDAKAFMKKVLAQDPNDSDSLSNKLTDSRYSDIAKAFNFYNVGNANLKKSSFIDGLVDKYVTAEFEKSTERNNPGVRLALYFKRMAPSATSWVPDHGRQAALRGRAHGAADSAGRLGDGRREPGQGAGEAHRPRQPEGSEVPGKLHQPLPRQLRPGQRAGDSVGGVADPAAAGLRQQGRIAGRLDDPRPRLAEALTAVNLVRVRARDSV